MIWKHKHNFDDRQMERQASMQITEHSEQQYVIWLVHEQTIYVIHTKHQAGILLVHKCSMTLIDLVWKFPAQVTFWNAIVIPTVYASWLDW